MTSKIKVLAVFLIVPVICFLWLRSSVSKWESAWEQQALKSVPADRLQEFSLSSICHNPEFAQNPDLGEICTRYERTQIFQTLSVWTAVSTLAFFLAVILAGRMSQSNRHLLLTLFRPGLWISHVFVAGLLLLQAALLSGTFVYAMNEGQIDSTTTFYSWFFGLAAFVGAFFIIRPLFGVAPTRAVFLGRVIPKSPDSELWLFVEDLAQQVGTEIPTNVVVGLTPEFFVTEAEVRCLDGELTGRTLYLSAPLCRILTKGELAAVVSHELGHFRGQDTAFTLHFYPIYKGAGDALRGVSGTADKIVGTAAHIPIAAFKLLGVAGSLSLYPAIYMMRFFLDCFAEAESAVSRSRELAADAVAAETAGASNIASALVKIVSFSGIWTQVEAAMKESLRQGFFVSGDEHVDPRAFFSNASEVFAATASSRAHLADLSELDRQLMWHPFDSHPPLSVRLIALKQSLEVVKMQALEVTPPIPASQMIDECNGVEVQLSRAMQEVLLATS